MSAASLVASPGVLNQLYASLCSYSFTNENKSASPQIFVNQYLQETNSPAYYLSMTSALNAWLNSSAPSSAVGVTGSIPGLRVQIIEADGSTAFDSNSKNNAFANINIPKSDFLTSGKYLINENQGSRSYNMGASLSQTGTFNQIKYSNSTGANQMYYAVRQGTSSSFPLGNIVISMNEGY